MYKEYSKTLTVRSYELDSFDHVNNSVYLNYLEYARESFLNECNIPFSEFKKDGILPVIVNLNIDFIRPAKLHDELEVSVKIIKIGNSSMSMLQDIKNTKTGEIINKSISTYVFIDMATERPVTIPEKYINAFKKF